VSARLWITGVGLVTPLGIGTDETWRRLVRGERGLGPIDLFDTTGQRASVGGQVRGLDRTPPTSGGWSRTGIMAHAAAREAMHTARLDAKRARVGLVVGGTTGGMFENEELLAAVYADPSKHGLLTEILSHPLWTSSDRLNEALGPFARVRTLSSACSSGANALIVAAAWLLSGEVDAVVAGGSDGLCRLTLSGFNALAAIDPEPCKPFDKARRGLNLGEGAGFVVLERDDVAKRRDARPVAELAGWALGAEAHHITNPEESGGNAARVIEAAMARARLSAAEIDYVNAHGTGTPLNDPMETAALKRALGEHAARAAVSSTKGQMGHTLAAAGAIEAAITALVVREQMLVPTAGLTDPDPQCDLVHVMNEGRPSRVRAALSSAFGFGGMNTVLVMAEPGLAPAHEESARRVVVTAAATLTPSGLCGTLDAARVLGAAQAAGHLGEDAVASLDRARARRLDRPARLGAVVVGRALEDAPGLAPAKTGVVLGSTFGSVDASAAFMHRIFAKGPRMASPAEFPNLVPSSPVGHVSIYLGLKGPVLAAAELGASGECAFLQGVEIIAAGEAEALVTGDIEEASDIVARVFTQLFARTDEERERRRSEGGGAVVLEAEEAARARGAKVIARVVQGFAWREGDARARETGAAQEDAIASLAPPRDARAAQVVLPRENGGIDALLARTPWKDVRRATCAGSGGEHEGLGAIALAAAVSQIARGEAKDVLVVGLAKGRGYAVVLAAP
jgi:3-oxoacyl-[acyl-carrier-protein] synthase II